MYPHSQILPWSLSLNLVKDEVEFLFFGIPQCAFPKLGENGGRVVKNLMPTWCVERGVDMNYLQCRL